MQLDIQRQQDLDREIKSYHDSDSLSDGAQNLFNELSPMSNNDMLFKKLNPDSDEDGNKPKRLRLNKNQVVKKKKLQKDKSAKKKQKQQKKHIHKKLKKEGQSNNENQQEKNPFAQDSLPREQFSSSQSEISSSESRVSDDSKPANDQTNRKKNKKNRKKTLQQKQGFNLEQLGNQPKSFVASDDSDASYRKGKKNKKTKKQKIKKQVAKNEDIIQNLLQRGNYAEDQEDEQRESQQQKKYFTGIQFDRLFKNNKKQKQIKVFNKLFQNLDFDDQVRRQKQAQQIPSNGKDNGDDQNNINISNQQMPEFQKMSLELKPKQSASSISQRSSFFQKMEHLKKIRGMDSIVNQQQYSNANKQRHKKSLMKLIDGVDPLDNEQDIGIEIKIPEITRGRSSDVMNNTLFLKKSMDSNTKNPDSISLINFSKTQSSQVKVEKVIQSKGMFKSNRLAKDRRTLFSEMQGQIRKRRSKYISFQDIKGSFKKTKLDQIQQDRKQIEQRRRKAAILGVDSDNSQLDQQEQDFEKKQQDKNQNDKQENAKQQQKVKDDFDDLIDQQRGKQSNKSRLQRMMDQENIQQDQIYKAGKTKRRQDEHQVISRRDEGQQSVVESQCQKMEMDEDLVGDVILSSQNSQRNENEEDLEDPQLQNQGEQSENESNAQEQNEEKAQSQAQMEVEKQQKDQFLKELQDEGINIKKKIRFVPQPLEQKSKQQVSDMNQKEKKQTDKVEYLKDIDKVDFDQFQKLYPEEFTRQEFKKLRKIANVISNKKKLKQQRRRKAQQFFDEQAQLGSDNQDHDEEVKRIDRKAEEKQYQGVDLDADLQQLIDNAVDLNQQDEQEAFKRYLEDVKMKDKQQLRKIIRGQFRERKKEIDVELQDDEKQRQNRMQEMMDWIQKRQAEDNQDLYAKSDNSQNQEQDSNSKKAQNVNLLQEQQSQEYANFQDLATYLDDNIIPKKTFSGKLETAISLEKSLPEQKKKQIKSTWSKRSSLLDSSLTSKKSICGFSTEQAKVPDAMKLKASKKSSSSSLNEILMKNKKKVQVKKPVMLLGFRTTKKI